MIVGGSDAGISAALRAREVAPGTEVTVVVADAFPNYSICGLPYYLGGEVPDWQSLAHRTVEEIERAGVRLLLDHTPRAIDPRGRTVIVTERAGASRALSYDRLVIATGAVPMDSTIEGVELPGVYVLHSMDDTFRMQRHLDGSAPRAAVIVGGGYIDLEMAEALVHRGVERVMLVVRSGAVLCATISPDVARLVEDELRRHGVELVRDTAVQAVRREGTGLVALGTGGWRAMTDLVLVAVGVRPASELAATAGIERGNRGAIRVNREMATSVDGIYAAGDCVETWHHLLEAYTYLPLGTMAHKQGRIAGENAVGGHRRFAGSLGTQVVKVLDLAVARTGLLEEEARRARYDAVSHTDQASNHKAYYPGVHPLWIQIVGDRASGRLLGGQIVGHWRAEVAKRIDILATAIYHRMQVDELSDLDLSYAPPFSSPWDPVQMTAQAWSQAVGG